MIKKILALMIPLMALSGCGGLMNLVGGQTAFFNGRYGSAISQYEPVVAARPGFYKGWERLGISYYKNDMYPRAIECLQKANALSKEEPLPVLYLGLAYKKMNELDTAIAVFRQYASFAKGNVAIQIKKELSSMMTVKMKEVAERALLQENKYELSGLTAEGIQPGSVAVLYFKNETGDTAYAALSKGIAELFISDLLKLRRLKVIERVQLQKLLEEMKLGLTGIIDEKEAPRIGRLLRVEKIVNGSYSILPDEKIRIDVVVVDTVSGRIMDKFSEADSLKRFYSLEKSVLMKVLEPMKVDLSDTERIHVAAAPTKRIDAFVTFSRGLDFADLGKNEEAMKSFLSALALDPGFQMAADNNAVAAAPQADLEQVAEAQVQAEIAMSPEIDIPVASYANEGTASKPDGTSFESMYTDSPSTIDTTPKSHAW